MPPRTSRRAPNATPTVVQESPGQFVAPFNDFIMQFATIADDIPMWGSSIGARDQALRAFWPTEPNTASAVYSMTAKYAAMEWHLEGPPRTVGMYQDMLNSVEGGKGWIFMLTKALVDMFTQDNAAWVELVRTEDSPDAPCVSMNHLDTAMCIRTGHKMTPIIYYDINGNGHLMKWYQVAELNEFPSPSIRMRGAQLSCISRLLRAAQIMRDISIYKREKVSGRFNRAIYFVSGVQKRNIDDALAQQRLQADQEGLVRFMQPLIIGSLDPGAAVKVDSVQFATLPDNFDEEVAMKWFISQLALAFGGDYQDFAPLPGGNLGSGQQSRTLNNKSRNKGSKLFVRMMQQLLNYSGVLPRNVKFVYAEKDVEEEGAVAEVSLTRAKERQTRILSGEITPRVARQIAVDVGDLRVEYMMSMSEEPSTTTIDLPQQTPLATDPALVDIGTPSAYTGTPEDQQVPGASSWGAGTVNGGDTAQSNGNSTNPAQKKQIDTAFADVLLRAREPSTVGRNGSS